ncbi:hypothetical protein EV13_2328 [Prochlorococcus sp. MIT 0702]|nr:hypothetical protein EV12_1952 [Prochlorococcus sp. MIT 0701]KGG26867.1 hypothetical protein EV13_2328 [Prochlorococcus sp. MIT 0702]KGG36143.1 hypothetical protein EV14_0552 [Prochlorococcus sp. MIT 0703]
MAGFCTCIREVLGWLNASGEGVSLIIWLIAQHASSAFTVYQADVS